jgi:hypothetical protein
MSAVLRVRWPSGVLRTFDADLVEVAHGQVTAEGYYRHDRERGRRTITWPARRVLEIRHLNERVAR